MRFFVVPANPAAQIPDPDRGGLIPPTGITLSQSSRLTDYISRGDVIATPLDDAVPPTLPGIDPVTDTVTVRHGNYDLKISIAALQAVLDVGRVIGTDIQQYDADLTALPADFAAHAADKANPHGVTPGQIGALTGATLAAAMTPAVMSATLLTFRNSLLPLPANDADIPAAGGWFVNGMNLVYIPPKV